MTSSAPPKPFRLRPARRGDAEALSSLLSQLGHPEGVDTATVHWVVSHPEIEILVAADAQDKPIAMLSFSHRPQLRARGRAASIDELIVAPQWRRKGAGKALMLQALERARVLNVNRLQLVVDTGSDEASRSFAQACGFQETGARIWSMPQADLKKKR